MKTIALLTDFGHKDSYVGVMKGVIASINPGVRVVDISHEVRAGDIAEAAFLLSKSYCYFPKKTIFLVVVDPGVGSMRKAIAVETKNYYFVGPDNGVLSIAAQSDSIERIVQLKNKKYFLDTISSTFQGRDVFAPVSAFLSKGVSPQKCGVRINTINTIRMAHPTIQGSVLRGKILYVDHFGNMVTNIKKEMFLAFLGKKAFTASLNKRKTTKLYRHYSQAQGREPFLIEGGFSLLEISRRNASAQKYFKAGVGKEVKIVKK